MRKTIFTILLLQGLGASAQTSVSSATFGTLEARHLGPGTMSGRISAIDGVAADEGKTIYVGAAGGGVWKTTNAGASFKSVSCFVSFSARHETSAGLPCGIVSVSYTHLTLPTNREV